MNPQPSDYKSDALPIELHQQNINIGIAKKKILNKPILLYEIFPDFCQLVRFKDLGKFTFVKLNKIGL